MTKEITLLQKGETHHETSSRLIATNLLNQVQVLKAAGKML